MNSGIIVINSDVPNDPQEWAYLVGKHLFGVSIILSHTHLSFFIIQFVNGLTKKGNSTGNHSYVSYGSYVSYCWLVVTGT